MLASFPYDLFGWCGRSTKGKGLKYQCSVLDFQPAVSLTKVVLALRTFRHLLETFKNPPAYLEATASPLHGSWCFFWVGLPTECLGDQKKVRARASNQHIVLRM